MKLNKSFAVPVIEAAFSAVILGSHAVMEKYWKFDKHSKLVNFLITGALSKDEMRIRRNIAGVMCAIGVVTDLVYAIDKVREHKAHQYDFDEICTRAVDASDVPDFIKEAYKAS